MVGTSRIKVLIRGLEPGSAYLAYLLAKSGDRVAIQTARPVDVYLYDLPPPNLFLKAGFLRDLLLVDFVDSADPRAFDVVVDSCDVEQDDVLRLYEGGRVFYVKQDPWLSATLSLSRGLPVPNVVDLPVDRTDRYEEVELRIREYAGAPYSLCRALDAASGKPYVPLRTLERVYMAADLFKELKGLGGRPPSLRLEYAVGRDVFFMGIGQEKAGKLSRVTAGGLTVWAYGEGAAVNYLLIKGDARSFKSALYIYNGLRLDRLFFLYDIAPERGAVNVAALGHLTRHGRSGDDIKYKNAS
ncbi:hypothetical protein TUZN_0549 [Thermoproteus uzoniensis 768-20]|uniref:Uncharacterized protein n=1 Tax=Thermoproteus uzoniensis (strain 768-20) TaxID=999630 RepID=F2L3Q9_THEU7|nr:hypothetical protein [Thermoproteus uzoniensis]AEA12043.1 hypothetical protein TUZN_0549 [Thermoproteus uzoniensis 768-20]